MSKLFSHATIALVVGVMGLTAYNGKDQLKSDWETTTVVEKTFTFEIPDKGFVSVKDDPNTCYKEMDKEYKAIGTYKYRDYRGPEYEKYIGKVYTSLIAKHGKIKAFKIFKNDKYKNFYFFSLELKDKCEAIFYPINPKILSHMVEGMDNMLTPDELIERNSATL